MWFMTLVAIAGVALAPWIFRLLTPGLDRTSQNPRHLAGADHVSVHRHRFHHGAGDGHAECEEGLLHSRTRLRVLQSRLHRRRCVTGLVHRSRLSPWSCQRARPDRLCHRHAHRRRAPARHSAPVTAASGLPFSFRLWLQRSRREGSAASHVALHARRQRHADQRDAELHLRLLHTGKGNRTRLAGQCPTPPATPAGPIRGGSP